MTDFKQKFTTINEDISTRRRLPRLGKIRLGIKKQNAAGKEYPSETPYFVCTEEVRAVYGDEPTELDILLPSDDPTIIFPQSLRWYGQTAGLKCLGDGETAERYNEQTKEWDARGCPCEHRKGDDNPKGECVPHASLMVLLPRVSLGGLYEIRTSSFNSIVDVNSGLDMVRGMAGRIMMVPIKLRRVPRATQHEGKKKTHYTLFVGLDANINDLNKLREDTRRVLETRYQIEGPSDKGPAADAVDVIGEDENDAPDIPATVPPLPHDPRYDTPEKERPVRPVPPIKLTLNPSGAERERQAKLDEAPPHVAVGAMSGKVPPPDEPPGDLYERPETRAAKAANRAPMTDAQWESWYKDCKNYPAVFIEAIRQLQIPDEKRPIVRGMRERFRSVFEDIATQQKVKR